MKKKKIFYTDVNQQAGCYRLVGLNAYKISFKLVQFQIHTHQNEKCKKKLSTIMRKDKNSYN